MVEKKGGTIQVKVKVTLERALKAQRGRKVRAVIFR